MSLSEWVTLRGASGVPVAQLEIVARWAEWEKNPLPGTVVEANFVSEGPLGLDLNYPFVKAIRKDCAAREKEQLRAVSAVMEN